MKKALCLSLLIICIFLMTGCNIPSGNNSTEMKTFTDDTGREVTVPADIQKVAVTGPYAQIIVFALCPDRLAGTATKWDTKAKGYIEEKYLNLPCIGQLYGGKGDLNPETLIVSGADIVLDVGDVSEGIKEELVSIESQTGIPCVHIDYSAKTAGETYRKLGKLLDMEEAAEEIAGYCERIYLRTVKIADKVKKENLIYIVGEEGLNVIAKNSYHSEIIDLLSNNIAVIDNPSSKGTGNEVDLEQLLKWNPDVLIISPDTVYDSISNDPVWSQINAVKNRRYYEVPEGPYNWMGFPPSIQRLLGMSWLSKILYPDEADFDLYEDVSEFYRLFFHNELTKEQYELLIKNSLR